MVDDADAKRGETANAGRGAAPMQTSDSREAANQASTSPAFDQQEALELLGNDEAFLAEIMDLFVKDLPERIEGLQKAVGSRDAAGVRREAHTLKGAAASLAANGVCRVAQDLEIIGASGDLTHADQRFQELQIELDRLVSELQRYLKALSS
jgi:HPt (histidine-containing phosphotransfer) domain-containing protein